MGTIPLKIAALSSLLTLAVAATAWAHVTVAPEEVAAEEYETLTVTVPTEKEIPTTEVRVEVPDGSTVSGVQPVPGWDYEFEEDGGTDLRVDGDGRVSDLGALVGGWGPEGQVPGVLCVSDCNLQNG